MMNENDKNTLDTLDAYTFIIFIPISSDIWPIDYLQ